MSTAASRPRSAEKAGPATILLWFLGVIAIGFFIPGAGLVVAIVGWRIALRQNRTARVLLVLTGALLLFADIGLISLGSPRGQSGPVTRVQ
jgi:energy-coupling factor transporter transmembrane protein EcfT